MEPSKRRPPSSGGGGTGSFSDNGQASHGGTRHTHVEGSGGGPGPIGHVDRIKEELDCPPPWTIVSVAVVFDNLTAEPSRVDIWVQQAQGEWMCSGCRRLHPMVGRTRTRVFRARSRVPELYVHVCVPIVACPEVGRREVRVTWAHNDAKWAFVGEEDDG